MSRTTYADDTPVTFRRPPTRAARITPTSLAEYTATFTEPWRQFALCIDQPPSFFFPESAESNAPAKRICEMCAVRLDCLDYAITTGQEFGIWGGTVGKERTSIRKMVASGKWTLDGALLATEQKRRGRSKVKEKVPAHPAA